MWRSCMSKSPAIAARFRAWMSAKNVNRTSSRYGSWFPLGSTPTKYGLRLSVKTWSLTRVAGVHAAMVGRSGFSGGGVARGEGLGPRLEARRGHELVHLVLLGVGRMEPLEVVRGEEDGVGAVTAVLVRERGQQQRIGLLVGPAHGRRAHFLDRGRRAVRVAHPGREGRHEVLVQEDVLVPEEDVVGGERCAVRPPCALAELDRPGSKVPGGLTSRGNLGLALGAVRRESHERVVGDPDVAV